MLFSKKIILTMSALLLSISASAHFSNMIVFGDSLSDIGNFPEPPQVYWDPQKPKTLLNAIPQFYVPFANPVDTTTSNIDHLPWPTLDNRYLSSQTEISGEKRRYRSIGWTQFFLKIAQYNNQTVNDIISPSSLLAQQALPPQYSFNYAWGYATSLPECVNPHYEKITCTATSIDAARENYNHNPSMQNYLKLEIPGLSTQIHLFLQDLQQHKVSVDKNTIYTFWIGGNDLIVAGNALQKHFNPFPAIGIIFGSIGFHIIDSVHLLLNALPAAQQPTKIYVFTVFNPGLSPAFYNTPITGFGHFVVRASNAFLKLDSWVFNLFSKTKIVIVPTYDWYQAIAATEPFSKTIGKACQMYNGNYQNVSRIPSNNCDHYLFWNDVHPSSATQVRIAKQFSALQSQQ